MDKIDGLIRDLVSKGEVRRTGQVEALPPDLEQIRTMFTDDKVEVLLGGKPPSGSDLATKIAKQVSRKAPIALELANKLIDDGMKGSLEEGIELELGNLTKIFSTKDALEGLSSIGKGRPEFKGE